MDEPLTASLDDVTRDDLELALGLLAEAYESEWPYTLSHWAAVHGRPLTEERATIVDQIAQAAARGNHRP